MVSCVKAVCLVVGLPIAAAAQTSAPPREPPAIFGQKVAEAIAARWSVSPDRIRLEWGSLIQAGVLDDASRFRLLGSGANSWFAVAIEGAAGGAGSARVRAAVRTAVPVSAGRLMSGSVLTADDIRFVELERWGPPGSGSTPEVETGWVVRQALAPGDRLAGPAVRPPLLVRSGDRVHVLWTQTRVSVRTEGVALNAGARGEKIRVRLVDRRGSVTGTVTAAGVVDMTPSGRRP